MTPADWFAGPVSVAATAGLTGPHAPTPLWTDAKLQPGQFATRAETAILLANLIFLLNSRTGPATAAPIR